MDETGTERLSRGLADRHDVPAPRSSEAGRYLRIYLAFVRNCLIREMEFRGHFFFMVGTKVLWSVLSLALICVIFGQVPRVAGWTFEQMLVLTGTYLLIIGLANIFFFPNMAKLSEYVNQGNLDFVLIRPLSSQFLVSARYIAFNEIPALGVSAAYVVYGLIRGGIVPSLGQVLIYLVFIAVALTIIYAAWFLVVTTVIWSGRIQNIQYLMFPFLEMARVPTDVFLGVLRPLLTFVLPIAFVSTVPAQALLGLLDPVVAGYGVGLAGTLLLAGRAVWRLAIRHYSSASS